MNRQQSSRGESSFDGLSKQMVEPSKAKKGSVADMNRTQQIIRSNFYQVKQDLQAPKTPRGLKLASQHRSSHAASPKRPSAKLQT